MVSLQPAGDQQLAIAPPALDFILHQLWGMHGPLWPGDQEMGSCPGSPGESVALSTTLISLEKSPLIQVGV